MKKLLSILLISVFMLSGCGSNEVESKEMELEAKGVDALAEAYENVKEVRDEIYNTEADIVKSGQYSGDVIKTENSEIQLISWDLGYSGNSLSLGDEDICIKFIIKNTSNETHTISELFPHTVYIDGVETMNVISDFYGDMTSYTHTFTDNMKAGSEVEFYICVDCPVETSKKVDIDIYTYGHVNDIYGTFSFDL